MSFKIINHNKFKPQITHYKKMVEQTQYQDSISSLLSEFATRLNEVEEKQRLLRDRTMLIGENFISLKEDQENEDRSINKKINEMEYEIKMVKQTLQRIMNELNSMARKTELTILQRQYDMFQPLQLARIKDVEKMINDKLKQNKK
ncbi:MAG: hypothetical protein RL557_857 [archaeon]